MKRSMRTILVVAILALSLVVVSTSIGAQGRGIAALAPKPAQLTPYTPPHKPHWKLSDVMAQNAGKQSWSVTVVDDAHLRPEDLDQHSQAAGGILIVVDNQDSATRNILGCLA